MTPHEFRQARRALGLSVRQLAAMLAVDPDLVRRMEIQIGDEGHRPIRGAVKRLMQAYLSGYRPPDWPVPEDTDPAPDSAGALAPEGQSFGRYPER